MRAAGVLRRAAGLPEHSLDEVACMKRYPSCIRATCVVPGGEDCTFLEDLFRHQVRQMLAHGTKHLYVFGTAGEGYAVTDRQFDQIVGVFADAMRQGGGEPMVGVISL